MYGGGLCSGGSLFWRDVCSRGVPVRLCSMGSMFQDVSILGCLYPEWGLCLEGGLWLGSLCPRTTPPSPCGQTDTCENLPPTSFAGGKKMRLQNTGVFNNFLLPLRLPSSCMSDVINKKQKSLRKTEYLRWPPSSWWIFCRWSEICFID